MDKNKCSSCGAAVNSCSCKNKDFTKAVIEIDNPEKITLMRKVVIPMSMGDDTAVPPAIGKYHNVLLYYEANQKSYLYSSDGIPTLLVNGVTDYEQAVNLPQINGVTLLGDKSAADLGLADAPMVITVANGNTSWSGADTAEDVYDFFLNKGKVNIIFNGEENYAYEIASAAYIPGEEKMMCTLAVATIVTGEPTEFEGNALFGTMTLYTAGKAIDVSQIELQPKLFIADFTGLDLNYNELSGVPATNYNIGMVKPGAGLSVASDGTLSTDSAVFMFDTVADMKVSTDLTNGDYARTAGFHAINDGGGALYQITDTGTADEMSTIAVGNLYANIIYQGEANVKQLGAYGDDTHDDSASIQAAVDSGLNVFVPHAIYKIDSKIIINDKKRWSFKVDNATFNYSGDDSAFEFRKLVYCTIEIGTVNALSGNCIHFTGDSSSQYSQYNNIRFTEFSALNDCIKVESNGNCWISENRVEEGRFYAGANGMHIIQNSSNGLSHWVINRVGVEGVSIGFNFEHGESSSQRISQWEFSEIRHAESITLFKSRGRVEKNMVIAPERIPSSKFDLDSGATKWKIISADRTDYVYEGSYYNGAINLTSKIVWSSGINADAGCYVSVTDQVACVHLQFYADTQIDDLGDGYLIAKHLPRPKHGFYFVGENAEKDEAMPRYTINTSGRLSSAWATNMKLYTQGHPCVVNVTYNINDLDDVILPDD